MKMLPSWLRSFDLVVEDEYETVLFNDYDFLPEYFNLFWVNSPAACGVYCFCFLGLIPRPLAAGRFIFIHDLGLAASLSDPNGVDVESIMLKDKEYKVVGIHIYSDKNTGHKNLNKKEGYYLNLKLIVREK